jgi:hypothetical protein
MGVFKTIHSQMESKRYVQSVDMAIVGPEREILAYEFDRVLGLDLVPPTVGRYVQRIGFGSVQAWVYGPTAWQWLEKGYDWRRDLANPWVHRIAAFHFITGSLDGHTNNAIIDDRRRWYSIDNGYTFTKHEGAMSRGYLRSSPIKHLALADMRIHPDTRALINVADDEMLRAVMADRGFRHGEAIGMTERLAELRAAQRWKDLKFGELLRQQAVR